MAHEMALSIIFESGWQGICDVPEAYLGSVAEDFLSQIHATWDETRFLGGYPGDYCCIARRKGDTWYVAGINAGEPRTVTLDLPTATSENVLVYIDTSDNLQSLGVSEYDIAEKPFEITMKRNGGFAFIMED